MSLKVKGSNHRNTVLKHIEFEHIVTMEKIDLLSKEDETLVVLLKGKCTFKYRGEKHQAQRKNVFDAPPYAFYIPCGELMEILTDEEMELAICKTESSQKTDARFITPDVMKYELRGQTGFERNVRDILDANGPSERLVVGETINVVGNWSSFPPHKHDTDRPGEVRMEELYIFKLNPEDGFGFQRIYTEDGTLDESFTVENNDISLIPSGYHPVCVMPGYQIYYLWVLVGESKVLMPYTQDKYRWIMGDR